MKRFGQIIGVLPARFEEYKKYHATEINGKYWSAFTCIFNGNKHIQSVWTEQLAGPWYIMPQPILSPEGSFKTI